MVYDAVKVSAPGKLMILGEHAVLHGKHALVCAINRRITVSVNFSSNKTISIRSELGHYDGSITDLNDNRIFRFVYSAITRFNEIRGKGMDIRIESEFSDSLGFGSSAAVTAALVGAIHYLLNETVDLNAIFKSSLSAVKAVQGKGSGADVAASVYGGLLYYRAEPFSVKKVECDMPITVINSGNKIPTTQVIDRVNKSYSKFTELYNSIFDLMDRSCCEALNALENKQWDTFGKILTLNHGLMEAMELSNLKLNEIIYALRQMPTISGAKISGSGLGDCVIGIGAVNDNSFPFEIISVDITNKGFTID